MLKGLYTAWSGMINEQNRMDVMTNNLANATTTGYKKEGTTSQSFDTVLAYRINDLSTGMNVSTHIGANSPGVKIGENYVDHSQGSFKLQSHADMCRYGRRCGICGFNFGKKEYPSARSKRKRKTTIYK